MDAAIPEEYEAEDRSAELEQAVGKGSQRKNTNNETAYYGAFHEFKQQVENLKHNRGNEEINNQRSEPTRLWLEKADWKGKDNNKYHLYEDQARAMFNEGLITSGARKMVQAVSARVKSDNHHHDPAHEEYTQEISRRSGSVVRHYGTGRRQVQAAEIEGAGLIAPDPSTFK